MNWLFLIFTLLFWQPEAPPILPVGQVQLESTTIIYAYPVFYTQAVSRARNGDVLLIYEIQGRWGRTEKGWLPLAGLTLETAVVHYSLEVNQPIPLTSITGEPAALEILPSEIAGVVGIFEYQALVYSQNAYGWTSVNNLTLIAPTPDLLDFVEQTAYIKVDGATFYFYPYTVTGEPSSVHPLGEKVSILHTFDDWVLVRAGHDYGWSEVANFDILPGGVVHGEMNAGPVNMRLAPIDGRVIAVLSYLEGVLVIGRNAAGDWLYIEARGLRAWVSARYVNFAGEILAFPEIGN